MLKELFLLVTLLALLSDARPKHYEVCDCKRTSFRYSADPFKMSGEVDIKGPLMVDKSELFDNRGDIQESKIGAVKACINLWLYPYLKK